MENETMFTQDGFGDHGYQLFATKLAALRVCPDGAKPKRRESENGVRYIIVRDGLILRRNARFA